MTPSEIDTPLKLAAHQESSCAQGAAPLQVYAGYEEEDLPLIRKFAPFAATLDAGHYTDGFGVKTLHECVEPFVNLGAPDSGKPASIGTLDPVRLAFPVPDDGFHAEAIEYVALVDALQRSLGAASFCAVEIGAAWAPWITAAGVIARRHGIGKISLVGAEAASRRFPLMCRHLETNGLRPPGVSGEDAQHENIFTRLFNGAVWTHDGVIWFPESDVADMGAAATPSNAATDYRGVKSDHQSIPCRKLQTLLHDLSVVDFMHIDIQGTELELLQDQIDWVSRNVSTLMIATHSRPIEGKLMELLFGHGWRLHREKPCRVDWHKNCALAGRTLADGSQYWLNEKLAA